MHLPRLTLLSALSIFLLSGFLPAFAQPLGTLRKELPKMEETLKGVYPKHRYAIQDPSLKNDVLKIAYVRERAPETVQNPFKGFPFICYMLPVPTWNNGEFTYASKNGESSPQFARQALPDDIIYNRFLTIVVDNPTDLADYDIIVRERFVEGTKKIEKRFAFAFLFYSLTTEYPDTEIAVTSPHTEIAFEKVYNGRRRRVIGVVLPFYYSDKQRADSLRFTRRLYSEMQKSIDDPIPLIRARKRSYVFSKDKTLKALEDHLRANVTRLRTSEARALLQNYKLRFDFLEHRRVLEEGISVVSIAAAFDAKISAQMALTKGQNRSVTKQAAAQVTAIQKQKDAVFANRLNINQGLLDVTFGRNYDLYDEELSRLMQHGPLEIRQYPIAELREIAAALEPIREEYPVFQARYMSIFNTFLAESADHVPPKFSHLMWAD